jgi:acetate---CoA ligase (ADP-forming)
VTDPSAARDAVQCLLEPTSIAVVGASGRSGSFGHRMVTEVRSSLSAPSIHLVNPRYDEIDGQRCYDSLSDLDSPVDLVLLGIGDSGLEEQLQTAAGRGDRSAIIFGNAYEAPVEGLAPLRARLATMAQDASMALCGAGCMGYLNVAHGIRAIGYVEPEVIPAGPVALVTHSGSVFSAVLRSRRDLGFSLAVSSGQELVTKTPAYLDYALSRPETGVVALVLETIRDGEALRASLHAAAERDVPVVLLPVGTSEIGRSMVAAHSGAVAGGTAAWEALASAHGVHLVSDLGELLDTVELFASGRRARPARGAASGFAAVLDSGAERALLVDVAAATEVPFASLSAQTVEALEARVDPGLIATNPLDVWGNGADTEGLFADVMTTMTQDPEVRAVALAIDLVEELDGDESYPRAALRAAASTDVPVVVLSHVPSAIDPPTATALRSGGVPVLQGTRSGLLAIRHLLDHADHVRSPASIAPDVSRRQRWRERLQSGPLSAVEGFDLLCDYGIVSAAAVAADNEGAALIAAEAIGYPVVLKTAEGIAHKTEVGGVVVGVRDAHQLGAAYRDLADRLGPHVEVCEQVPVGTELLLGAVRDPNLGMVVMLGVGGVLVEQLPARRATLPPLDSAQASRLLAGTVMERLLAKRRQGPAADRDSVVQALVSFATLVAELGDDLDAIEVNPLVCLENRAIAVDVYMEPRTV